MFTQEQLDEVHARLGNAETFADYVLALKALGVEKYESFLTDGHSEFSGAGGHTVVSPPTHAVLHVSEHSDKDKFLRHLALHEQGETSYFEMSAGLAESGIEKWTVDTTDMTMIYYDRAGNAMLVEQL
jgi:uncharacterized protein YbcV (DUF1398 family)